METTLDKFLGGRVEAEQPAKGFRAGHDTVLVAAAVPARAGERVLELGSGAGIASLCLAARVAGADITGVEIDPELVALANANAARNGMSECVRFVAGDVLNLHPPLEGGSKFASEANEFRGGDMVSGGTCPLPEALRASTLPQGEGGFLFDHVFFNPPFHPDTGQVSPSAERDRAMRSDDIAVWWKCALDLVKKGGTVTAIVRADRAYELTGNDGVVLPLRPRENEPPKRAIVQLRKHSAAPLRTLTPMILHRADGGPTDAAEAVLRHAQAITL